MLTMDRQGNMFVGRAETLLECGYGSVRVLKGSRNSLGTFQFLGFR